MLLKYIEKKQKFQLIGLHRYLRDTKGTVSKQISIALKKISTYFKEEIKFTRNKFIKADLPLLFINNVTTDFNNQQETAHQNNKEELIIPSYFFDAERPFLKLRLPYCEKSEAK